LLSTLNAAFIDYDFSDTKASEFSKEPSLQVTSLYVYNTGENGTTSIHRHPIDRHPIDRHPIDRISKSPD
jgi:hypothetical protein